MGAVPLSPKAGENYACDVIFHSFLAISLPCITLIYVIATEVSKGCATA